MSYAKSDHTDYHTFKPIYSIGCWNDPEDNDNLCASAAILTFSGIDELSDFSVIIVWVRLLKYKVVWPSSMTVSSQLHAVWIDRKGTRMKIADYHGMVKCFHTMVAPMRRQDCRVETLSMISINMKLETRPEIHLLAFLNTSARLIYIILHSLARKTTNLTEQGIVWEQ